MSNFKHRANKDLIEYRKELIDFTEKLEKVKASGSTDFQINQAVFITYLFRH